MYEYLQHIWIKIYNSINQLFQLFITVQIVLIFLKWRTYRISYTSLLFFIYRNYNKNFTGWLSFLHTSLSFYTNYNIITKNFVFTLYLFDNNVKVEIYVYIFLLEKHQFLLWMSWMFISKKCIFHAQYPSWSWSSSFFLPSYISILHLHLCLHFSLPSLLLLFLKKL